MVRSLAVLLLAASPAAAQIPAPWDRPGGFGGGFLNRYPASLPPIIGGVYFPPYYYGPPAWSGSWGGSSLPAAPAFEPILPRVDPLHLAHVSSLAAAARRAETRAAVKQSTTLVLELPAVGEVWLNGAKQPGPGPQFTLTADAAADATFTVRAKWTAGGQAYEYERTLTVPAGGSQALAVVRGTPAK